jgi:WD40 repeat protein
MSGTQGHEAPAWMVTWSPSGDRLATASEDGSVRVWRAADAALLHVLCGHDDGVWSATWSPDGQRLVSGGNDGRLCLWEAGLNYAGPPLQYASASDKEQQEHRR